MVPKDDEDFTSFSLYTLRCPTATKGKESRARALVSFPGASLALVGKCNINWAKLEEAFKNTSGNLIVTITLKQNLNISRL